MDALYDMLFDLFGDGSLKVLALIVFVATAATAFGVMALVHSRGAVKRRAAGINHNSGELGESNNSLRRSSLKAVQRVLDYTGKHYEAGDKGGGKVLRRRMVQAGIYNPQAVAMFFVARTALAVGLAVAAFVGLPLVMEPSSSIQWLAVMAAASSAMWRRASISIGGSRRFATSTGRAFRISWTSWWCARTQVSAWKRRSSGLGASLAIPIHHYAPTCIWRTSRFAPGAP